VAFDGEPERHKIIRLSPVAYRWLSRNHYVRALELDVYAEILHGQRILASECNGGFEITFNRMRRGVVMRVIICIEEDDYSFYIRWIHDVVLRR
jgi:hypothetical protein